MLDEPILEYDSDRRELELHSKHNKLQGKDSNIRYFGGGGPADARVAFGRGGPPGPGPAPGGGPPI